MKRIATLIVDDEDPSVQRVKRLVERHPEFHVVNTCHNGKEALDFIQRNDVDLVLLDIEMPIMTGIKLLNTLEESRRPLVVFLTAYDQYALQAFEYFAIDYLLKPFSNERFEKMLERVKGLVGSQSKPLFAWRDIQTAIDERKLPAGKITVKTGKKYHFIEVDEIAYITADKNYCEIKLLSGPRHIHRETLSHFENTLPQDKFARIHHSYIVRLDYIKGVNRVLFGDVEVVMKDGATFKVSRKYKNTIRTFLKT